MSVERPMITMVIRNERLRPIRSPSAPNTSAPKGRTAKPAPNVARLARKAAVSLPGGKNRALKKTARLPYRKKSYHSKTVPSDAAITTRRILACSSSRCSTAKPVMATFSLLMFPLRQS